jgi:hypothetical protein
MRVRFIACEGCGRHVRDGDAVCPFCGAVAPVVPPIERVFGRGLSRAAMFAAGTAGVVVAMADCGSGNVAPAAFYGVGTCTDCDATVVDAGDEDGNTMTGVFYGVASCPLCEAGSDTSTASDAGTAQDATPEAAEAGD